MEFEFSNGAKGTVKAIPPLLLTHHLVKASPPPLPPDGNYQDAGYLVARTDWTKRREALLRKIYFELGVEIEVPAGEVKAYRKSTRDTLGIELDGSDKFVYISCLCIGSTDEFNRLVDAILSASSEEEKES